MKDKKYGEGYRKETLEGWRCEKCNKFMLDERAAKLCCVDSRPCEVEGCDGWTSLSYYYMCDKHNHEQDVNRWRKYEERDYHGEPLVIFNDDRFFWNEEELLEYCVDEQVQPKDLLLVFANQVKIREFDANEYWCDDIGEDDEIHDALEIEKIVNDWAKENIRPCWHQGKERPTESSLPTLEEINA